jgi:hypothetical protein
MNTRIHLVIVAACAVAAWMPLVVNADGAVRLVFSPQKPVDVPEVNWIQTNPEKGFFAYFRLYSPTQAFFDRSWKMGNIKEIDR